MSRTSAPSAPSAPSATAVSAKYDPSGLPATGTRQFRQGGDYKAPLKDLAKFAKGKGVIVNGHVKALVHLGWVKPGGTNDKSKAPAFTIAAAAGLPPECWTVGEDAGAQISANVRALAAAGADPAALDALWTAYAGY